MKCLRTKLVLAILTVSMVITCNQESSVSSPQRSLPREDPTLYGFSLWLARMQYKLDNGSKIEDIVSEYEDLVMSFSVNLERVALYLPTETSLSSPMTEDDLLQYLNNTDNFLLESSYTFYNQIEKNTIFTVLPNQNPFSNDTVYFNFLTTYYSPGDTVVAALLIHDKPPLLLNNYENGKSMSLLKTGSVFTPGEICSHTSTSGTSSMDLTAYYYTKLVTSISVNFAGNKILELLTLCA